MRVPRALPELTVEEKCKEHAFDAGTWEKARRCAKEYIQKWSRGTGVIGADNSLVAKWSAIDYELAKHHCFELTAIEFYSLLKAKVPTSQHRQFLGRGGLPHVSLKPVQSRCFLEQTFAATNVDCWSRMCSLLAWLLPRSGKKPTLKNLSSPIMQLRDLVGKLQSAWKRCVAPNCPVKAWEKWLDGLTPFAIVSEALGYSAERIGIWLERATAQKRKAIELQVQDQKTRFKTWLEQDLKSGAAGAHALVKDKASSWQKDVSPAAAFDSWATLWGNTASSGAVPLDWRRQLDECVSAASEKGSNLAILKEAKVIASTVEDPNTVDCAKLRAAASSYPDKKSKGVDQLSPNFICSLPDEILMSLVDMLNAAQRFLCWPIQIMLNLMAIIPKPTTGTRTVAKTPMLYRLWCITRSAEVKQWAAENAEPWDFATTGKSALFSGAKRCYTNELGTLSGKATASLLWDMDKFYDNVQPEIVLRKGIEQHYPATDLVLALSMHMAPRLLFYRKEASQIIIPSRSIIAGCSHSGRFGSLVINDPVSSVAKRVPTVKTSTFVDDVAQIAIGTFRQVAQATVDAGVLFASKVKGVKLTISKKSVVVASSPRLATIISQCISKHANVTVRAQSTGRDLGVENNPTGRRVTGLQQARVQKAIRRTVKIARIAKVVRKASALAYTGALPQAGWGVATQGMAPTVLRRLRSSYAAASGISARGRCTSTAIAIAMGQERDPLVHVATQQLSLWIDLWREDPALRALAARHWREAYARVLNTTTSHDAPSAVDAGTYAPRPAPSLDGLLDHACEKRAKWNAVIGPMTATMATLIDLGWDLSTPGLWVDYTGKKWVPDLMADKQPVLDLVRDSAIEIIQTSAATGWCGKGLEHGVDWDATLALYRHIQELGADNMRDEDPLFQECLDQQAQVWPDTARSWLEALLTGAYWPQARYSAINPDASDLCSRCGKEPETAFHLLWGCPCNGEISDFRVSDTQVLIPQAHRHASEHTCLWLRGILTKDVTTVHTPYVMHLMLSFVGCAPPQDWPSGLYHTDASGGDHSAFKDIRRCGIGLAFLCQDEEAFCVLSSDLFLWGAFAPLPGKLQTVPRAELYAILVVCQHVVREGHIVIVSDSKLNVDAFNKGEPFCMTAANCDLWREVFDCIEKRALSLQLLWSKGHADDLETFVSYNVTARNLLGNLCADALARRGAEGGQVSLQDAMDLKWHHALVKRIQARAVVILNTTQSKTSKQACEKVRPEKVRKVTVAGLAIATEHRFTTLSRTLHCYVCLRHSGHTQAARRAFLQSPCKVDVSMTDTIFRGRFKPATVPQETTVQVGRAELHSSHRVKVYRGLYYCAVCGYYAHAKAQKLSSPCQKSLEGERRALRLNQGKLPSGMSTWPNDPSRHGVISLQTSEQA